MATETKDPEVFLTQVNDALEDLSGAIGDFLEKMANFVNDHLTEAGVLGGAAAGSLFGPLGTIAGGIIGGLTGNELEEKFEAACDEIREKWDSSVGGIREAIGGMIGDPLQMSEISSDYRDAARTLGIHTNDLSSTASILRGSWDGRAFFAFMEVNTQQTAAVTGLGRQLITGADLMDKCSERLVKQWLAQINNIAQATADFINVAGDLGDLGNAPTFEAGPATKLIGAVLSNASTILTDYGSYVAELEIDSGGDWDGLDAAYGTNGLPGGQWPEVHDASRGAMNGPWASK
jgi:uncharacterized protein YukE